MCRRVVLAEHCAEQNPVWEGRNVWFQQGMCRDACERSVDLQFVVQGHWFRARRVAVEGIQTRSSRFGTDAVLCMVRKVRKGASNSENNQIWAGRQGS